MQRRGVRFRFGLGVLFLATAAQQEQTAERPEAEFAWAHTTVGRVAYDTANCPCNVARVTEGQSGADRAMAMLGAVSVSFAE